YKRKQLGPSLRQFKLKPETSLQPGEPKTDLFSYFPAESVTMEALPKQIRSLLSLREELQALACEKEEAKDEEKAEEERKEECSYHRRTSRAVQRLWNYLLLREPLPSSDKDLLGPGVTLDERDMLMVDRSVMQCRYTGRPVWTGDPEGSGWRVEALSK